MIGMARVKRTYNLSESTVRTVRELSEQDRLGRTQDFVAEAVDLENAYRTTDRETWPA